MKRPVKSRTKRLVMDLEATKGDARGGSVAAVNRALHPEGPPIKALVPSGPPIRQLGG